MVALNCKDPAWGSSRFDWFYYPETKKAKYVLYGTPAFIGEIMVMFSKLAGGQGEAIIDKFDVMKDFLTRTWRIGGKYA